MADFTRKDFYVMSPADIIIDEGWNPREHFDPHKLDELKNSIREQGVITPLQVRFVNGETHLVDGERRLRACLQLMQEGLTELKVPVIRVQKNMSDIDRLYIAMLTNTGEQLTPLEEAKSIQRLLNWGHTEVEIAKRLGKSVQTIRNRLDLIAASPEVLEAVQTKMISINDALQITRSAQGSIDHQSKALEVVKQEKAVARKRRSSSEAPAEGALAPKRTYVVCVRYTDGRPAQVLLTTTSNADEVRELYSAEGAIASVHPVGSKAYCLELLTEI
jgi:ParB family chromosome partitioning protein